MFILLPLICLAFLFFIFHHKDECWRNSILSAALVWGVILTAITEILSLGLLLTFNSLVIVWFLINFILIFIYFKIVRKTKKQVADSHPPQLASQQSPSFRLLLFSIIFLVAMIGLTGLIAAPNNWDSMTYRLARVVHWIQNQSVAYYPTSYLPQLYQKPWPEFTILHFQILSGGDRFAFLVQWLSMISSIIGVSLIAKQLGANQQGQILSAVICATIPTGILQGSSTQGDYVVSNLLVCFVYYVLLALQSKKITFNLSSKIGASLGLAFFAKGTAYIYTFPFLIWFSVSLIKRLGWKAWKSFALIMLLVVLINFSHELRNIDLFGRPLASGDDKYTNEVFTLAALLSNIIRNIALHIYIPLESVRESFGEFIGFLHSLLAIGISDPRTTWIKTDFFLPGDVLNLFHEDISSNTIHLLLIIISSVIFLRSKQSSSKIILGYFISALSSFLLFCYILKWQPWHSRLHLPFFVIFSPFIGVTLSNILTNKLIKYLALIIILSSLPWVFCNTTRPLLFQINKNIFEPSTYENIFQVRRIDQYFKNRTNVKQPYIEAASFLNSQECSEVGLLLKPDDWEYPLWMLLQKDKEKNYRIEQIQVNNISAIKAQVFPHNNFVPCAIIAVDHSNSDYKIIENNYFQQWSFSPVRVFLKK